MENSTRAVLSAAAASLVAVAAYLHEYALLGLAVVVVVVFAVGWPALLDLPARGGASVVVGLGGLGALGVVYVTTTEPFLRELPLVVALAVLLAFVHELLRSDGRERLVQSTAGVVTGVLVATAAAGWLAAGRSAGGTELVLIGAVALAVGTATAAVPTSPWVGFSVAVVASGAVGAGLASALADVGLLAGVVIGVAVGILGVTLRELFDHMPTRSRHLAAWAAIVVPVTVTGTLVYVVGRVLVG